MCPNIADDDVYTYGLSKSPTLRVGFGERAIYSQGIVATRSQCVLGLHRPDDKVCYTDEQILSNAEKDLATSTDNL